MTLKYEVKLHKLGLSEEMKMNMEMKRLKGQESRRRKERRENKGWAAFLETDVHFYELVTSHVTCHSHPVAVGSGFTPRGLWDFMVLGVFFVGESRGPNVVT